MVDLRGETEKSCDRGKHTQIIMSLMELGQRSSTDPTLKTQDMEIGADQVAAITQYVTV